MQSAVTAIHGAAHSGAVGGRAAAVAAAAAAVGAAAGVARGARVEVGAAEDMVDRHQAVMFTAGAEDDEWW